MQHALEGLLFLTTFPMTRQEPAQSKHGVQEQGRERVVGKSHQTKRLCHQCPRSQELANDESAQDGLDLGDTAVLGIDGIFLHKQCRTTCKEDLFSY